MVAAWYGNLVAVLFVHNRPKWKLIHGNLVTPALGLATIHDRDVLIYCISQLVAAMNQERDVNQVVKFKAYDLLTATNRPTAGSGYEGLKAAFERLGGTRISTNIITGGQEVFENFGVIEWSKIVRETRDGRMQEVQVKLSDWVFNAIQHKEVLTLHRDYFRLRKPIERRIYELARKHCGSQEEWRISLELLQKKCGSSSTLKEFRRLVSHIAEQDKQFCHIPDYSVTLDEEDSIHFKNRGSVSRSDAGSVSLRQLDPEAYHDARLVAPGWDVYMLEREWRGWMTEPPHHPEAAFIGFCKKWYEKRGRP